MSLKYKASSMRESIFSHREGILASWWEITYLTQYLLSTYLSLMDAIYPWVKGCIYKLLSLSLTPQLFPFSFVCGLGKVQTQISFPHKEDPDHVFGTWGKVMVGD